MVDVRGNIPTVAGPLDNIADPGESFRPQHQAEYLRQFLRLVKMALSKVIHRDQAAPHFHLVSVGGKVYRVRVDETGTLVTEYVRG